MRSPEEKVRIASELGLLLQQEEDVLMAFVFGSWAKDQETIESDLDVAVYLRSPSADVEWGIFWDPGKEEALWARVTKIAGREVDLIILNRAPATVAEAALRGVPLVIKDRRLYLDFLLRISSEATDFREWSEGYWRLKEMRKDAAPA